MWKKIWFTFKAGRSRCNFNCFNSSEGRNLVWIRLHSPPALPAIRMSLSNFKGCSLTLPLLVASICVGAWIGMEWVPHFHPSMVSNVWVLLRTCFWVSVVLSMSQCNAHTGPTPAAPNPAIRTSLQSKHHHPKKLGNNMTKGKRGKCEPRIINFNKHRRGEKTWKESLEICFIIRPDIAMPTPWVVLPPLRNIRSIVGKIKCSSRSCLQVSWKRKMS